MVRSVGRGLDPSAGGCPGDGCWRKPSRGVGDAAPYGLPGNGRRREPAPHPALRGHLPPRGKARAVVGGSGSLRGASGTPPPTVCPGAGGDGRSRRGGGTPPYVWGDMETLWSLREQSFPGRRAVGAGHARPGSLRRQASTVRSVGRGLDPSAGVDGSGSLRERYPGEGRWREVSRGVGDAAPYGLPGEGRQREPAPHPALRGHLPPRGKARAVWRQGTPPPTPAAGPRCGAGGSGCSTSGLTKPALYRRNLGRCRDGSRQ